MNFNEFAKAPKAVVYHDTLNPILWDGTQLKTEIRYKLMLIAKHFANFLKVDKLNLQDITISGSNAAYGYSDSSDLDLHLIVDMPTDKPELNELYDAKKNVYNTRYNIKIKQIDVELYVQDSKQVHHSAGIYSILNDKWITQPKHAKPRVGEDEVRSKARNYAGRINIALKSTDVSTAKETMANIRKLRQAGLEQAGEFSVENLAFKLLRARGQIDKLRRHIDKLESASLSIGEQHES
jgi:molecular chaperone GrpE (heat shock protein)